MNKRHAAAVFALVTLLTGCAGGGETGGHGSQASNKRAVTVGVSGSFAENQIVAEMYAQVLEKAGYRVTRRLNLQSREISEPALERGELDIVPEYLGSLLVFLDKNAKASSEPQQVAVQIRKVLEKKNAVLLDPSPANDTNAFVVASSTAEQRGLHKVSDLAPIAGQLTLGGPPECPSRPFCIPGLKDKYGINFKGFKPLDVGGPLTVAALEGGQIDVAVMFTTSPIIKQKNFVVLEDDKNLQQAENITPLVGRQALNTEIRSLLNGVSSKLSTEKIRELNGKVEIDHEDPADVARKFLSGEELV